MYLLPGVLGMRTLLLGQIACLHRMSAQTTRPDLDLDPWDPEDQDRTPIRGSGSSKVGASGAIAAGRRRRRRAAGRRCHLACHLALPSGAALWCGGDVATIVGCHGTDEDRDFPGRLRRLNYVRIAGSRQRGPHQRRRLPYSRFPAGGCASVRADMEHALATATCTSCAAGNTASRPVSTA